MSIQFRSRIKSNLDYSTILNGLGVCCDKDGNKSLKSFYDCSSDGGNYFQGEDINSVNCPDPDTQKGCCCACAFVQNLNDLPYPWDFVTEQATGLSGPYLDSGIICNISQCECERINGKFTRSDTDVTLTQTNWKTYCVKDAPEFGAGRRIDARYPRACCNITRNQETGWPTDIICENTCTQADCAVRGSISNPAIFNNNLTCSRPLTTDPLYGQAQCNIPLRLSQMVNKSKLYKDNRFGSCYTLELSTDTNSLEYQCDITIQENCNNGHWVASENQSYPYCSGKNVPYDLQRVNGVYQPASITQSEFDSLNLTLGENYQGGKYIGVFTPGYPINTSNISPLYGSRNFVEYDPVSFIPDNVGNIGGPYKKWIVIANMTKYKVPFLKRTDQFVENDSYFETSMWDGYYNTYGTQNLFGGVGTALMNSIKYKNRNGFIDYYIPSLHEMYFFGKYYQNLNYFGDIPINGKFLTSTIFTSNHIDKNLNQNKINNKGFVYGYTMNGNPYAKYSNRIFLTDKYTELDVLFFRRIIIK